MLSRTLRTAVMLGAGLLVFASFALAASKTITLSQDVLLPGGQTLKAGTYTVVVNQKIDQVEFLQNSKVVATHACKCIEGQKNDQTETVTEQGPGNQETLQQIRLRGETRTITLPT
jgi:HAMP domain-containing protein